MVSIPSVKQMTEFFVESSTWELGGQEMMVGELEVAALGTRIRSQVFLETLWLRLEGENLFQSKE